MEPWSLLTEATQAAREFASGEAGQQGLTLLGPVGVGKTMLLTCIGNDMLDQGYLVKYTYVPDMVESFRSAHSVDSDVSYDELLRSYHLADVLLLDDITEIRVTDFAREAMTRLMDLRIREGGLYVVATNLTYEQMAEVWGYRLADRIYDAGRGQLRLVTIKGASYRTGHTGEVVWRKR